MTLASSGSINMVGPDSGPRRSIGVELGNGTLTTPVSLLSAGVLALVGKSGGPVTMPGDFYGRSVSFVFVDNVTVNTANYDLSARATAAGWDGVMPLYAQTTIYPGIYVYSTNAGLDAMFTSIYSYPAGSLWYIVNTGLIVGAGGNAGAGGSVTSNVSTVGGAGGNGGNALSNYSGTLGGVHIPIQYDNASGLTGGGGGGGGGGGAAYNDPGAKGGTTYGAGGGGGGGGVGGYDSPGVDGGGTGGAGGTATVNVENYPGSAGTAGDINVGSGIGAAGGTTTNGGGISGGTGGSGGTLGVVGAAGASGSGVGVNRAGGAGGLAGYSLIGTSKMTDVGSTPGYRFGPTYA
jgi:hypothetical protein